MTEKKAKKRKVSNLLGLAVLSYLVQGPRHPYELSRMLRDNDDGRSIKFSHGSLYMAVQQLARAGFIAEQETTREGQRPERTVYALTEEGRREQRDWLCELVEEPRYEYPQFVAALSLSGALHPDEAVGLLRRRLERLDEQSAQIRALVDGTAALGVASVSPIEEQHVSGHAEATLHANPTLK